MAAIPLSRAAHLAPYIKFMLQVGVPLEKYLSASKLPQNLEQSLDSYIPTINGLNFLEKVNQGEGMDMLRSISVSHMSYQDFGTEYLKVASNASSLFHLIQNFIQLAELEDNTIKFWLKQNETHLFVCSYSGLKSADSLLRYNEWSTHSAIIQIVRHARNKHWLPPMLGFHSRCVFSRQELIEFEAINLLASQPHTWIAIPLSTLTHSTSNLRLDSTKNEHNSLDSCLQLDNFAPCLKLLMESYLGDTNFTIKDAAELSHMSVRTVQRKLNEYNTDFTQLKHQAIFERAKKLLSNPDNRVLDIAMSLGFEDGSNFARAFRNLSGMSPSKYRRFLM